MGQPIRIFSTSFLFYFSCHVSSHRSAHFRVVSYLQWIFPCVFCYVLFFFFGFSISTGIYAFPLSFLSSASDALNGGKEHLFVVRHFSMHLFYFVPHSLYCRCIAVLSVAWYLLRVVEFQCDDNFGRECGIHMARGLCLFLCLTIPPMDVNENIEL